MEIKIRGRNIDVTPATKSYVDKKFDRLSRHLPQIVDATMEISKTASRSGEDRIVVQLTLGVKGQTLRAQRRASTVYEAVDASVDVMEPPDTPLQGPAVSFQPGAEGVTRFARRTGSRAGRGVALTRRDGRHADQGRAPEALFYGRDDRR